MRQKSGTGKSPAEAVIKDIRRATRRHYSAEDKIRIVLEGLRGEETISALCRREGIADGLYYSWSKEFLEAGKKRLAFDTARAATTDEVKVLRRQAQDLKEVAAGREIPAGLALGATLAAIGMTRILLWQKLGFYNYGEHWGLVAATVGAALVGIVTFGSLAGYMLPFILQRRRLDPTSASAPFVATLVDVTGLVIYFRIAMLIDIFLEE
jgi:transposase